MIGKNLGHFRVNRELGHGGMGQVYLADDLNLSRKVALKFLPDIFTGDPERMARFEREAKLLASLNHPNIAAIYGLEQAEGKRFLVLEYVEGETLAQRISKGPISLEEALGICRQITNALEAAHEKGIIHRDLKPANTMIAEGDKVKILDFGLAKALADETQDVVSSHSPTLTEAMTRPGVILGTAAYMSPEQAKGKPVDKRADIWAFGCILYECLTGRRIFEGETVTETLAAILKGGPDWSLLPESTPAGIRTLLHRCLEKDAKNRFRDAADVRIQIEETLSALTESAPAAGAAAAPGARRRLIPWAAAACGLGLLLASLAFWILRPASAPQSISRTVIPLPPGGTLATINASTLALSPDGKYIAYAAYGADGILRLYLRALDSLESKAIPGSEGAYDPFFSPDGQWVGFAARSQINKVAVGGGAVLKVCSISTLRGASWGSDGTIVFPLNTGTALSQVSAAGGVPQQLTKLQEGESSHRWPQFLPNGKTILFTITRSEASSEDWSIAAQRLDTGERKILVLGGTYGRYASTGHLVYCRAGVLMAVPFDAARLKATGTPVPVMDGIMSARGTVGSGLFSFSDTGSLAYVPGISTDYEPLIPVWVDRKGAAQSLPAPAHPYNNPRLSPDGRQLALSMPELGKSDIWIYDLLRNTLTRLTFEGSNGYPLWTPDGRRVTYRSRKSGMPSVNLFWKPSDGSGPEERLTTSNNGQTALSFSPDGKTLVYCELDPKTNYDLWALPLDGERKPRLILQTPFNERTACFSPDGKWLAYVSDESGRYEVYAQPFPGPGGKFQISVEGASEIFWRQNGELTYRAGANREKMMAVDIRTQPVFAAGKPRLLFEAPYISNLSNGAWIFSYSVSADGQRFLMLKAKENTKSEAVTQINIVQNWFEELKQRVPVK